MSRKRLVVALASVLLMACVLMMLVSPAQAAIPLMINHQGIVKVNGLPFTGNGLFKFGFVDTANLWLWTNDGTHLGQLASVNYPNAAITLPVSNGIYNVRLGDTAFANMAPIPSTVFDTADVKLRIVFNDGANGWQLLSPDQPVTSTGFAYHAATADNALLLEGSTAAQLAVPTGYALIGFTATPPPGYTRAYTLLGGNRWESRANMPSQRAGLVAAYANGLVYAIGGSKEGTSGSANEAYDPDSNTWTTKAAMPTGRTYAGAAVVNGLIYVIGGSGGATNTANEAYDPSTNTWDLRTAMPTARCELAVAQVNGIIYAIGGVSGATTVATNEAYNPATNTWSTKTPMPTARRGLTAVEVNGIIYAIGGQIGSGTFATNEAYDPATNTWSTKAPMPTELTARSGVSLRGRVYALGGYSYTSGSELSVCDVYDPTVNTWTQDVPLPSPRAYFASAAIPGDMICAVGGNEGSAYKATNEIYARGLYVFTKN